MAEKITIVAAIPGRHRGGMTHPRAGEYPLGSIDRAALAEIARDDTLTIVRGELVTAASLDALLADNDAARAGGGKKKPA